MKILRILTRMNGGGPVNQVVILNNAIPNSILVYGSISEGEVDASYLAQGLKCYFVPELKREINIVQDIKALIKICKIVWKEKPDIIHTHTSKAGVIGRVSGIMFKLCRIKNTRLFHTFHGNVFDGYFSPVLVAVIVFIERVLALFTDKLIAITYSQKEELLKRKIAKENKIEIIPLGLELDKFIN